MNALLNYNMSSNFQQSQGFNGIPNFNTYQNFMNPSFSTMGSGMDFGMGIGMGSGSLSSALANIPMGNNYGMTNSNVLGFSSNQTSSQTNLKQLLKDGIITQEEYKTQLRLANGIMSEEEIEKYKEQTNSLTINPSEALTGEELEKARTTTTGSYKVRKEYTALASQYIEAAKEIFKKEPAMMSEKDIQTIEKIFAEVNRNPMLAEAFIKEANETTLSGKTTTLLGKYEQALTKLHGRIAAKEIISEVKESFKKNISGRNPELYSEFERKSNADATNVEYSFGDKIANNPTKYGVPGVVVGTGLAYGGYKGLSLLNKAKLIPGGTGKVVAGVAVLGLAAWAYFGSKEK